MQQPEDGAAPKNKKEKKKKTLGREILEWTEAIVLAVIAALLIRSFLFTVVRVDGESMTNTLADNDRLIVWRAGYEPKQGDIVIFKPDIPENEGNYILGLFRWDNAQGRLVGPTYYVKRVIATAGQRVEIDYNESAVYVDGKKLDEPYIREKIMEPRGSNVVGGIQAFEVDEGCVFVLGDNRNGSRDSRDIGMVSEKDIVGKAMLRFWPLNSFGAVTHGSN